MNEALLLKKKAAASTSTFNPSMKSSNATLSNNNRTATMAASGACAFTSNSHGTGKWYFETTIVQSDGPYTPLIGVVSQNTTFNDPWTSAGELLWYGSGNQFIYGANIRIAYGTFTTGDVISFAADLDARLMQFFRNGSALAQINMNSYLSGIPTFWAAASDPHGSQTSCIVTIPDTYKYMPNGYSPW